MFVIETQHDLALVRNEVLEWQRTQRTLMLRLDVQRAVKEQTGACNEQAVAEFEKGLEACQAALGRLAAMIQAAQERRGEALTAPLNGTP